MATSPKQNPADIAAEKQLQKERNTYQKGEEWLLILLFLAVLFGLFLLFLVLPTKEYSKTENRELQGAPEFTLSGLMDGSFSKKTVAYLKDQFPFKDQFVGLNAAYELAGGRLSSGGVIYGKDGYLLNEQGPLTENERSKLQSYAKVIDLLSSSIPTVVALAGNSSQVMTDKLPAILPVSAVNERSALIEETFSGKNYTYINLQKLLFAHRGEEIYYRTDHHWTTLGAFYASSAILEELGGTPLPIDAYRRDIIIDDFKGTAYNRSGMFWLPGENMEYFRYDGDEDFTLSFCAADGTVLSTSHSLYNISCLLGDYRGTAYDSFVAPVSTAVVKIEKEGENRPVLLVLKDSFAHSALSFLAKDFDIITVDIRQNADYAYSLIKSGQVDMLLVLVNADTLLE